MLHIGSVLDRRYRVDYVVKQGGMGTVYGAQDLRLDRPCAVKAVPTGSAQETAQIQREARVLGRLCHPHLPAIYDFLEENGVVFVIMQMIPGDDLEAVTVRSGSPGWDTLVGWGLQLAEVVQYLHEQTPPVIHRDIKPANIRLAPHGQIYLVDFGIAKLLDGAATVTAARAASVPYAPIEQIQDGSHTDRQSDIYAFGATLYRLLTSRLPPSCIDRLVGADLTPISQLNPSVPHAFEQLVHRCMELWSTDRPSSMAEVISQLHATRLSSVQAALESHTVPMVRPALPSTRGARPSRSEAEARTSYAAGIEAFERGDLSLARLQFGRAIDFDQSYIEAYVGRAKAHAQLGLYEAAIDDWNRALARHPDNAEWRRERAATYHQRHDYAAALADLTRAIELAPEATDAYLARAEVRKETGDSRGHFQDLDRILQLAPQHRPARLARALGRMDQQLWQAALPDCNALIQYGPDDVTGYLLRAKVYTYLGDTTRVMRDLSSALAIDPDSAEAYFLRGRLHQRSGDRQAALRDFNLALANDHEHVEARHRRAQIYRVLGAEREALGEYRALCRMLRARVARRGVADTDPRGAHPITLELQYLMQTGGIEKARKYLHAQAASFREDSDEDLEERAGLFERVGQFDAALDDMERSVKILSGRQRAAALPIA